MVERKKSKCRKEGKGAQVYKGRDGSIRETH